MYENFAFESMCTSTKWIHTFLWIEIGDHWGNIQFLWTTKHLKTPNPVAMAGALWSKKQNKTLGVNTPSDLHPPFFYPVLFVFRWLPVYSGWVCKKSGGVCSLHCVRTADLARTRARSISVMGTLAQCINLITLASHFSCMKPSPALTATGCTLGQSLLHLHYQQRAKKVLT